MQRALELLRQCLTPAGFVAALDSRANYRRIWSRDGCVCGLGALVSGDEPLIDGLRRTLEILRDHQGPSGQIASNVAVDGSSVSYGGTAGRVDATIWYVLATCLYGRLAGDDELVEASWPALSRAVELLRAWEFNDGGLLYVPQAGDWADEYVMSGYLLYDQVLRLWALRELDQAAARLGRSVDHERSELGELIAERFEPRVTDPAGETRSYFCAGFNPGARYEVFDALGNALCCLLELGSPRTREASLAYAVQASCFDLVPAFHPAIEPGDPAYEMLERAAGYGFRNAPGRYHNGGLWPMVTGFWVLAARQLGQQDQAERWAQGIAAANRKGEPGFAEYLDAHSGAPGGTQGQGWSAAAEIIATSAPARLTGR